MGSLLTGLLKSRAWCKRDISGSLSPSCYELDPDPILFFQKKRSFITFLKQTYITSLQSMQVLNKFQVILKKKRTSLIPLRFHCAFH